MILTDLGRALLLGSVPLAALVGRLELPQLYLVALGVGVLSVFFGAAYGSLLPSIVKPEELLEGNRKLVLGEAIARAGGPGLAGVLIQLISAPLAIGLDALSFVVSAGCVWLLRTPEHRRPASAAEHHFGRELREGLGTVLRHPLLRPMFGAVGLGSLGDGLVVASGLGVLYGLRELHLEPALLGGAVACLGIGGLFGAMVGGAVTRQLGPGRTFMFGAALWSAGYALIALANGSQPIAALVLALGFGVLGAVNPIVGGTYATLRQVAVPPRLLGRVTAVGQVVTWGGLMLGTLVGGAVADRVGLRSAVGLAALPPLLALLWMLASAVRHLHELPEPTHEYPA